jgi:hypothetical protein
MFDIYTIIFLVLAVVMFLMLRGVLGQRTGRERPPMPGATNDNLVSTDTAPASAEPIDRAEGVKGIAEPGSSVASGLDAIARKDNLGQPRRRPVRPLDAKSALTPSAGWPQIIMTTMMPMKARAARSTRFSQVSLASARTRFSWAAIRFC